MDEEKMASYAPSRQGSETAILATMHSFLLRNHGYMDLSETIVYAPSKTNQIFLTTLRC